MADKKKSIIEEAKEIAEDIVEAVGETAEKVAKKAKKVEKEIVKKVEEIGKEISEKTEEVLESVEDEAKKLGSKKGKKKSGISESLLEKAKKLGEKVTSAGEATLESLKEKVKVKETEQGEEKKDMLVPIEEYLKSSIHLGTRVITPDMRKFVYRRRADGLAVFNTALLDDMVREGADFLAQYAPEDVIVVCKREAGWSAINKFAEITGMRTFTKKYPAGILTNSVLENFTEAKLIFICDPWLDKNALNDALKVRIPILSICDTNNYTRGITKIIPGNNKSAKSLGMVLYLLAKIYNEKRKLGKEEPKVLDFVENWENLEPPK